jgi:hypothetical protein
MVLFIAVSSLNYRCDFIVQYPSTAMGKSASACHLPLMTREGRESLRALEGVEWPRDQAV